MLLGVADGGEALLEPVHRRLGQHRAVAVDPGLGRLVRTGGGVDQQLELQLALGVAAHVDRHRGGEVAAGAVAADADAGRVDADLGGVVEGPAGGGQGVVVAGGEGVFGREAVVHRQDLGAGVGGEAAAVGVVSLEVADDPAAAVEIDQARAGRRGVGRGVEAGRDRAAGAADLEVARFDALGDRVRRSGRRAAVR